MLVWRYVLVLRLTGMARSNLLRRLVGLAVAGCLAGTFGGGAGAAAGKEDLFCPAVRDQLWTTGTLHDWVSFSDQLSVVKVVSERALDDRGGLGYVGRGVRIRVERTFWRRPGAARARRALARSTGVGARQPRSVSARTSDSHTAANRASLPDSAHALPRRLELTRCGRLLVRRRRLIGGVPLGEPTFAHQMLAGLPVADAAGLVRRARPYRAAVRLTARNPVRRWNATDRDHYRLQGQRRPRPVIVAIGSLPNTRWRLDARQRTPRELCLGLHARPLRRLGPAVRREACRPAPTTSRPITATRSVTRRGTFIYGSAAEQAAQVEVAFQTEQPVRTPTRPAKPDFLAASGSGSSRWPPPDAR